eukprot:TRINITY_DN7410_c0_g1_i1.p1 TRINITY_DN7410_c0_g1~~TRINITY_DN7410_c0_g1_i1.p1  ORF type:complete len:658 (-),score=145.76 TRINITY_DN7410_c0_g1_i1:198-2171(-)
MPRPASSKCRTDPLVLGRLLTGVTEDAYFDKPLKDLDEEVEESASRLFKAIQNNQPLPAGDTALEHLKQQSHGELRHPKANWRMPGPVTYEDAVSILQDGFPVFYFDVPSRRFVSRIVKVDDRLVFFMVTGDPSTKPPTEPVVTRLKSIPKVHLGEDATKICQIRSIKHDNLNKDSVIVVQLKEIGKFEEAPALEKMMVFLCAPGKQLGECIMLCMAGASEYDVLSMSDANRIERGGDQPEKQVGIKLVRARVHNADSLFDKRVQNIELQFEYRRSEPKLGKGPKKYIQTTDEMRHSIDTSLVHDSITIQQEVDHIEKHLGGRFDAVDRARVLLLLGDCVAVRMWAEPLATEDSFGRGLHMYLQNEAMASGVILQDQGFSSAANLAANVPAPTPRNGLYAEEAIQKSLSCALSNLLTLESAYAKLVNSALDAGCMDEPMNFTLCGELVSADIARVELEAKEQQAKHALYQRGLTSGPTTPRKEAGEEQQPARQEVEEGAVIWEAKLDGVDEDGMTPEFKKEALKHLATQLNCDKVEITSIKPVSDESAVTIAVQAVGFPAGSDACQKAMQVLESGSVAEAASDERLKTHTVTVQPRMATVMHKPSRWLREQRDGPEDASPSTADAFGLGGAREEEVGEPAPSFWSRFTKTQGGRLCA